MYNKVIQLIGNDFSKTYSGIDLISVQCSDSAFDSNLSFSPGICEQYANIELYDRNKYLTNKILNEQFEQGVTQLIVKLVDETANEIVLNSFYIESWAVDMENGIVKIDGRDPSYLFDSIETKIYDVTDRTLHVWLTILFSAANNASFEYDENNTLNYCNSIMIPDSWCLQSKLQEMLQKICEIGILRIYWHINRFIITRGV